jgi:UPF0716 protein FxsA
MIRLLLLFTLIPALELYLLLQIGAWLGPTATVLIILTTGVAGAWLAKREGLGVLSTLMADLQRGMPPGERLMEGALVVAGGLLLITPGVFTDIMGFLLIAPWSRRRIAPVALAALARRFQIGGGSVDLGPGRPSAPGESRTIGRPNPFSTPFDD